MHRIVRRNQKPGKPVLMMHQYDGSSMTWLVNNPDRAPGLMFAVNGGGYEGYDVWLANTKGNYYSW